MKEKTSAGAARNLSKKLHPNDILRKFAIGMTVVSDCHRTLRMKMTSITLPFDSRKSRKFTENPADLGTSGCSCCFVDSGCARTYVGKISESMLTPFLSSLRDHADDGFGTDEQ